VLLLALATTTAACGRGGGGLAPPVNLYILIASGRIADPQGRASLQKLANSAVQEFMRVNPGVNLHLRFANETDVAASLRQRAALGASPDLLISRVAAAAVLAGEGLTEPSSLEPDQLDPLRIRFLSGFRQGNRFRAIPFLLQPNLACYDRRRIASPPATLGELLWLAEQGRRVGLPLLMDELIWTGAGFGAEEPILRLFDPPGGSGRAKALTPEARQRVLAWLRWLYRANVNPSVQFVDSSEELVERLAARELDWISCNSTAIARLRRSLGANLAVSVLPGGDNGEPAQPLARLQLLSFGRDSTPAQRAMAERFALFLLNDFSQNNLMVRAVGNLPVNQNVIVPVKDAPELAAMEQSLSHSIVPNFRTGVRIRLLRDPLMQLLKQDVYGERGSEQLLGALEALALRGVDPVTAGAVSSPMATPTTSGSEP
jgi:hypothetical protein